MVLNIQRPKEIAETIAEEFKSTNARFFGENGLPATQTGWTDTATGSSTIDLVTENVLGIPKQVVRHNDNFADGLTTSKRTLTAQNWTDINSFGSSFSGKSRLDTDDGANGFLAGLQADSADNPLATGNRRYGIVFDNDGGNLRLTEADNTGNNVTMDGTLGNPTITFDEWFVWECVVPAGLGAGQFYINGELTTFVPTFFVNGGVLGTSAIISSVSSSGVDRISYHDNFGATIYEEAATRTLLSATMNADIIQVFVPDGKRDYVVILPDGNPRSVGNRLDFILRNLNGKLTVKTEVAATPQSIFNGLREVERDVALIELVSLTNILEAGNVYVGDFEKIIDFEHSGLISSGDIGGVQGMSIIDADTFRIEKIRAVIIDRKVNTLYPKVTNIELPQTDRTITGGGDQVVNTYINKQGEFEFRAADPTVAAITDEIFIGKTVMDGGVIFVAVFTPVVAYTGSTDSFSELIGRGGHKVKGSILSAGGANLTLSITTGDHHQLGRGFLIDSNIPNICSTPADSVVAFTGANGGMNLVHADAGGNFIIDANVTGANPDIDPIQFNNGGTLAAVPTNDVTAMRVYQFCVTNDIVIYYGTVSYMNMAAAEAGFLDEDPEVSVTTEASHICTILVKETVTDLTAGVAAGDVIFKNRSGNRDL